MRLTGYQDELMNDEPVHTQHAMARINGTIAHRIGYGRTASVAGLGLSWGCFNVLDSFG